MITGFLVQVFTGVVGWLLQLLPTWSIPSWVSGIAASIASPLSYAAQLGNWFPLVALGNVATALVAVYALAWGIRAIRMFISHVTGGGGGAA